MYGLVANVISDRQLRTGAKVWVLGWHGDFLHPRVYGLSKGGQMIQKYTHFKRLERYRVKWMPDVIYGNNRLYLTLADDDRAVMERHAEALNYIWSGIVSYTRDGTEIRHYGLPMSIAYERMGYRS